MTPNPPAPQSETKWTNTFTEPTALLRYSKAGNIQVGWRVYRQDNHGYVHSADIEWRDVEREQ